MKTLTFVIFGGTGDLARKKLGGAISLFAKKNIDLQIQLIGVGRSDYNDKTYKKLLESSEKKFNFPKNILVRYYRGDVSEPNAIINLEKFMIKDEKNCVGRIYYLATSSALFGVITREIAKIKESGFTKIMLEKPFGHDGKSSEELNKQLYKNFKEEQIYRVDHYLAKETVNNILLMRFSNPLFENVWNSNFIDKIKIRVAENFGVEKRLAYYNNTGAIKDMIQNHLFQILLFILMEPPKAVDSKYILKEKYSSAKKIKFEGKLTLGRYEGYDKEIKDANLPDIETETYAKVFLTSKQKRWKGIDIILETGKNLDEKEAHITLEYKKEPCILYCSFDSVPNKLIFRIQPTQNVELTMNTNEPGDNPNLKPVRMTFYHEFKFSSNTRNSYEMIISECYKGEKELFMCENVLRESWRITDKMLRIKNKSKVIVYKKGSKGPKTYK